MANLQEVLGRDINSIAELKKAIRELQDSLVGLDTESQEYKSTSEKLIAAQDALKNTTRAGIEANNAAKDSVVGMQKEYNELYNVYKKLTDEERNSDFGKTMAENLSNLSEKINTTKKEAGNFTSNIGHYAEGATEAFNQMGVSIGGLQTPLKMAAGGTKTLGTALKGLAANPVVLTITLLVALLAKVATYIKENEELTNRLKVAMAAFKPVLDLIANVFDALAGLLVRTVEGLSKVAEKVMSIIPGFREAAKSHKELAKATNELTKAQRDADVENSKKAAHVEMLREEASATEDLNEKRRLLEEAKAEQAEIDQRNIELAQEELRIAEEYAAKTANSTEANDKLAASQKKVNDAIATGERNMRQYNKQLTTITKSTNTATSSGKNYREEARKLYLQLVEDSKDEITKLTEKYDKEKKLLERYHIDTSLLTKKYEKERKDIVLNTLETTQKQRRASYETQLNQYAKYISTERELLKNDPIGLANFNKQIAEETLEKLAKLQNTFKDTYDNLNKLGGRRVGEAFRTAGDGTLQSINDYASAIEALRLKIAETEDAAEGTNEKVLHDIWVNQLEALQKFGPEEWDKQTKEVQKWVDVISKAYGMQIDSTTEIDRLVEVQKNNIKELLEIPKQVKGEEAFKRIEEEIKKIDLKNLTDLFHIDESEFQETFWDKLFGVDSYEKNVELFRIEGERSLLEEEKKLYEQELANFKGTQDQKLEMLHQYYEVVSELRQAEVALDDLNRDRTKRMVDDLINWTDAMATTLSTIQSSYESLIDSEVKSGKIEQAEADRKKKRLLKLQEIQTAFSIATIAADAASGIFSIWKGYATEKGVINPQAAAAAGASGVGLLPVLNAKSLISAIAQTASLAGTATAQIMAARNGMVTARNNFMAETGGGASVGVGATPMLIDSTPYSYTRTIQDVDEEDEINQRPIWVSVVDVENALGQQAQIRNESSF